MFRHWLIIRASLFVELAIQSPDVQAQEASMSPGANAEGSRQIPYRMLQQLAFGLEAQKQFRSKIPPKQIEVIKKAQADRSQRDIEIAGISGKLGMSPFKNRRLRSACEDMQKDSQDELHAEWLKIITPEQQAALRSRNRQAILQASLESQRPSHSLLSSKESIDQLLTNEDYLSIIEQPWIQDLLEITDEQLAQIEELQKLAQPEALDTMRQLRELVKAQQVSAKAEARQQPGPSDARKQLQERAMQVLSQEQTEKYKKLFSDPDRMQTLFIDSSPVEPRDRFLLMLPHGAIQSTRTDMRDDQSKMSIVLHNAFERPELIKELGLSDFQQKEIATIPRELSPQITTKMEAEQAAFMPHGAIQSTRTDMRDDQSKMSIVLHNAFERPELIKELGLSDFQQKEIATIPRELSPQITTKMEAEQAAFREREQKRRDAHDELLRTHVVKFSAPAKAIITESQQATLEKERFRGLGLATLQNPQVKATLKLTEEQSRSIAEIQSRRGPQFGMSTAQPVTATVSPEEFRKRSQEFQKRSEEYGVKAREFMDRQSEDIAAVLSDEQRINFTQMTGFQFPRDRGIRVPATSL